MKNANGTIGNRTRDLPACSVMSRPTAPPRAAAYKWAYTYTFLSHLADNKLCLQYKDPQFQNAVQGHDRCYGLHHTNVVGTVNKWL